MKDDERILRDPAPEIGILQLGESSVNFFVRPWVRAANYWSVKCDLLERVKLTFDEVYQFLFRKGIFTCTKLPRHRLYCIRSGCCG